MMTIWYFCSLAWLACWASAVIPTPAFVTTNDLSKRSRSSHKRFVSMQPMMPMGPFNATVMPPVGSLVEPRVTQKDEKAQQEQRRQEILSTEPEEEAVGASGDFGSFEVGFAAVNGFLLMSVLAVTLMTQSPGKDTAPVPTTLNEQSVATVVVQTTAEGQPQQRIAPSDTTARVRKEQQDLEDMDLVTPWITGFSSF